MAFKIAVKEKIARVLGSYFTTDQIVNVFTDANIPTDKTLYAKWRIILDAFNKMPDQEAGIRDIIGAFCHPLNFSDVQIRKNFVQELNKILAFEFLEVWAQEYGAQVISSLGEPLDEKYKSPTDYILEALNFFKNEYNKVKLQGLTYEYCLGELEATPDEPESEEYQNSLKAVRRLKEAGFITEYELGVEETENGVFGMAICKIDESKIIDTNQAPATEAKVQEFVQKIEITGMPELKVKGLEERVVLQKPKDKKIQLRKFPSDLRWEEISIQFLNEHEVIIKARNETLQTTYEAMGFQDEKRKLPNKQWVLLRLLAARKGEISWENNTELPLKDINKIKKQKQLLSEALKAFFQIKEDPFNNYKTEKSYRVKITLIPEPEFQTVNERDIFEE